MKNSVNRRKNQNEDVNIKIIKYSIISAIILSIIALVILIYSKNLNNEIKEGTLTSEQLSEILNNVNSEETESASMEIGKKVNEVEERVNNDDDKNEENKNNNVNNNLLKTNQITPVAKTEIKENLNLDNDDNRKVAFEMPVEGEIIKNFATDTLVYSETLKEWTTHTGIDIKAEKTVVIKSAESGVVKKIKNDPRYGLTIIIEHDNGYKTVYSNLLSSEFVVEGEKVEKGQSIGTVGNTAAFESVDEPHLHFEIIKDSVFLNPTEYLN